MGTNYYIKPKDMQCHHQDHWIHLGKSNMGQRFTFQAYPRGFYPCDSDLPTWPVVDYESWQRLLNLGQIYDEYGHKVNKAFVREMVERKKLQPYLPNEYGYVNEDGTFFMRGEFS